MPENQDEISKVKESTENNKVLLDEIHENILGDIRGIKVNQNLINNVLGELIERREGKPRPAPVTPSQVM